MKVDGNTDLGFEKIVKIVFDDKSIEKFLDGEYDEPLTLDGCFDIALENGFVKGTGTILVIAESGLKGIVYRYGNRGDFWEEVGKTNGYA